MPTSQSVFGWCFANIVQRAGACDVDDNIRGILQGMFFLVSTLMVSVIFYLVVVKWQPLSTEGFKDFGDISEAIMLLDETAKPVAEMAPLWRR